MRDIYVSDVIDITHLPNGTKFLIHTHTHTQHDAGPARAIRRSTMTRIRIPIDTSAGVFASMLEYASGCLELGYDE